MTSHCYGVNFYISFYNVISIDLGLKSLKTNQDRLLNFYMILRQAIEKRRKLFLLIFPARSSP